MFINVVLLFCSVRSPYYLCAIGDVLEVWCLKTENREDFMSKTLITNSVPFSCGH